MRFILVPHDVGQNSARIWAGATESPAPPGDVDLTLEPGEIRGPLPAAKWRRVTAGGSLPATGNQVYVQTVSVSGLASGTAYRVTAPNANSPRFRTLPAQVPSDPERPFTVWLGSCFSLDTDREGLLGFIAGRLPEQFRPDVKILCGDQVYLDNLAFGLPSFALVGNLGERFLKNYLGTWGQRLGGASGYQVFLETGGTYFTADDHEFWNNYPNWTSLIFNSWSSAGRERWEQAALGLFQDFQSPEPPLTGRPQTFRVDPLSFFVADTRVYRRQGDSHFMRDDDLSALEQWVRNLDGPGVLVLGQPVFEAPANWLTKRLADRLLSNYEQYRTLARVLFDSRHSILLLTGDVHFGRIARCTLREGPRPVELYEVISSPCSLVSPLVGNQSHAAVAKFPPKPFPEVRSVPTQTFWHKAEDQFVTLQFHQSAGRVLAQVNYWFPKRNRFGNPQTEMYRYIQLT